MLIIGRDDVRRETRRLWLWRGRVYNRLGTCVISKGQVRDHQAALLHSITSSLTEPPPATPPPHHHEGLHLRRRGLSRPRLRCPNTGRPRRSRSSQHPQQIRCYHTARWSHRRRPRPADRLLPRPLPPLDHPVWSLQHARDSPQARRHKRRYQQCMCRNLWIMVQPLRRRYMDRSQRRRH